MNKNISQPITNRANKNIINQKKDSFPNNRNNKKPLDELNISYTYKNIINSHTIDSTRLNNNISPLLNDNNSFLNKNRKVEDKNNKKNNELYQKSINGLADEVMKPSFLKSDVSMTMLGNNYNNGNNSNNTSTDSFLFLAKNKMKKKNKQNESYSFVEIHNNVKRNSSPFNRDRNNNNNNNNLNRNRSFLY